jgi:hypothetical protein
MGRKHQPILFKSGMGSKNTSLRPSGFRLRQGYGGQDGLASHAEMKKAGGR